MLLTRPGCMEDCTAMHKCWTIGPLLFNSLYRQEIILIRYWGTNILSWKKVPICCPLHLFPFLEVNELYKWSLGQLEVQMNSFLSKMRHEAALTIPHFEPEPSLSRPRFVLCHLFYVLNKVQYQ